MSLTTENKWRGLLLYTNFSGATDEPPVHHVRLLIFTVVVMEKRAGWQDILPAGPFFHYYDRKD